MYFRKMYNIYIILNVLPIARGGAYMKKIIFCNLDLLRKKLDPEDYKDVNLKNFKYDVMLQKRVIFIKKCKELVQDSNNEICFYSRKMFTLNSYEKQFKNAGYTDFHFWERKKVENFVKRNTDKNNYFVFVGSKDADFFLAVNMRALLIVPTWLPLEEKTSRYGIHVSTVTQLIKFILVLNNHNVWYSRLKIDEITTAYSLMDARYVKYAENKEEKEMIENFQKLLKEDKSYNYSRILLYHFLAGMMNSTEFDDIELFGMIPSSNCDVNKHIYNFMTTVRLLKGKRLPRQYTTDVLIKDTNLLIRHTEKQKAHIGRSSSERIVLGAQDEFETLCINSDYKRRIERLKKEKRFNVIIFDDYMTHGNSFNAVRNLLENLGANKIIFVSLGLFRNPFQKKDYCIFGDVYSDSYTFEIEHTSVLNNFEINNHAKKEVAELCEIFHS